MLPTGRRWTPGPAHANHENEGSLTNVSASFSSTARRLWRSLPPLLQGAGVAVSILIVGQLPPGLFVIAGLRYTPDFPWWLAATAVWLWLFWQYLDGRGWPATTSRTRREHLRGRSLPARLWLLSMLAGGSGMLSVLSGALLTGLVTDLPAEAYAPPLDLTGYAWWNVVAFFVHLAAVAGVVEEAAFRGYMLSIVERRHGWLAAIASSAVLFYVVHSSHAYATSAFIPFFMAYSLLHGLLVFTTRSILPSVVLHAAGDLAILPIQYGVVANPLGSSVGAHVLVVACFAALSVLALMLLARSSRPGSV